MAVLQGIVENGGEIQEEQAQKKVFQEFLSVFRREKWEEAEVLSEKVWPDGSRIRKKVFFLELEEVRYELYQLREGSIA